MPGTARDMSATETLEAPESAARPGGGSSLGGQVDAMVAAATTSAAPAPEPDPGLTSLDAELASLADEMVEGAVQSAEEVAEAAAAGGAPASTPRSIQPAEHPPAGEADPPPQAAPVASPATPVASPSTPLPPPASSLAVVRRALVSRARDAAIRLAVSASAPLARHGPHARQVAGYAAAAQLFFAACLWAYVLVVREPSAPPEPVGGLTVLGVGAAHGEEEPTAETSSHAPPAARSEKASGPAHAPAPKPDAHGGSAEKPKAGNSGPKPGARSSEALKARERPGVRSNQALPPRPGKPAPSKGGESSGTPAKSGGH